jgi:hypothetical protein
VKARITQRAALPAVALVVAVLGVTASTATAASLTPASYDFGSVGVGTASPPAPFVLSVRCTIPFPPDPDFCDAPDSVIPEVSIAGDFSQTNNCPSDLSVVLVNVTVSCTINVSFIPTAAGSRLGTLSAGGFTASLSGTGLVPAIQAQSFDLSAAIKRCKKKFSKGTKKRKKCIKKAKKLPV